MQSRWMQARRHGRGPQLHGQVTHTVLERVMVIIITPQGRVGFLLFFVESSFLLFFVEGSFLICLVDGSFLLCFVEGSFLLFLVEGSCFFVFTIVVGIHRMVPFVATLDLHVHGNGNGNAELLGGRQLGQI